MTTHFARFLLVLATLSLGEGARAWPWGGGLTADGCDIVSGYATFYTPTWGHGEGGPQTRHADPIRTVETAILDGGPVTLAADSTGEFGRECNNQDPDVRCLVFVHAPGFDGEYPAYRGRFRRLPKDTFIGLIEDSGSRRHFEKRKSDKAGKHIDIAVGESRLARHGSETLGPQSWILVDSPCGDAHAARGCDLSRYQIIANQSQLKCWPTDVSRLSRPYSGYHWWSELTFR